MYSTRVPPVSMDLIMSVTSKGSLGTPACLHCLVWNSRICWSYLSQVKVEVEVEVEIEIVWWFALLPMARSTPIP